MSTYTQPHHTDPDDVAPVAPDPRRRSTLTKRAKAARTTARDYGTAPVRNGSIDALMVNDGRQGTVRRVDGIGPKASHPINKPIYRPSLTVYAYVAVGATLIACAVMWLCAGRPALTGWQL